MEKVAKDGTLKNCDEIPDRYKRVFVTAHDVSPEYHMKMQAAFQKFTDNAVSKTVNFSNKATKEEVRQVYELAYKLGCKGVTIYRDGSRDEQVLTAGNDKDKNNQNVRDKKIEDNNTFSKRLAKKKRPKTLIGRSIQMETG